jgi:glycosyltransferase 2 family protein
VKLSLNARRALAILLVAAPTAMLVRLVLKSLPVIRSHPWEVDAPKLLLSVVAHVAVLSWGVWVWSRVQDRFEHQPVRFVSLLRFWFLSNLARYVPGLQFVAMAQMSATEGHRRLVMVASLLAQTGLALLSALIVSAWTLGGGTRFGAVPLGIAATAIGLAVVHPAVLNWGFGLLSRRARKEPVRWNGRWLDGGEVLVLTSVSWLLYGGAYYLFLDALTPLSASYLPELTGINALSFAAGLVAFVVPGGWGVREYTMTNLLPAYVAVVPAGVAAILSAASRLWSVVAELLGGGLSVLASRNAARPAE